jgi:hypothetical protein
MMRSISSSEIVSAVRSYSLVVLGEGWAAMWSGAVRADGAGLSGRARRGGIARGNRAHRRRGGLTAPESAAAHATLCRGIGSYGRFSRCIHPSRARHRFGSAAPHGRDRLPNLPTISLSYYESVVSRWRKRWQLVRRQAPSSQTEPNRGAKRSPCHRDPCRGSSVPRPWSQRDMPP